jgi:hypothetical protein
VDASQVLGSPQLAGLIVVPRGFGASAVRAASNDIGTGLSNAVGASLNQAMQRTRGRRQQAVGDVVFDTPRFAGYGLLALTAQELALVTGPRHPAIKVLARMPRDEIEFADKLGHGFPTTFPLAIAFRNGRAWYLEVQWNRWRGLKRILALINAEQPAVSHS